MLTRAGSHVGLLGLVVVTVLVGRVPLNRFGTAAGMAASGAAESGDPWQQAATDDGDLSDLLPSPLTNITTRPRSDLTVYAVQSGDTVTGIASQFGVSPDSILWANPKLEDNPDWLSLGQTLNIPPMNGVMYTVQKGDSLAKIVSQFKGKESADDIQAAILKMDFNQSRHELEAPNYALTVGQFLMVPDGSKPFVARAVPGGGTTSASAARVTTRFAWPISGRITQQYWSRHPGIDIAAPSGTPIYASNAGAVSFAGWDSSGFGNMILINHGNGCITRYGHLSQINVLAGQSIRAKQVIGRVGSTGHSTGPHLHFEIICGGAHRNPYGLLR